MVKYVVKIVSPGSGSGKTYVGTKLVGYLKERGYYVGVVKHCMHDLILEGKDTSRYLEVGADVVVASSKNILVSYVRPWVDDLKKVLELIETPLVVVEGFRTSNIGDTAGVIRDFDEFEELIRSGVRLDAIISGDDGVVRELLGRGFKAFSLNDLRQFYEWVEGRALETVVNSLPGKDCGMCGYSSCRLFSTAYLKGVRTYCVNTMRDVRLTINGDEVQLNPFVRRLVTSLVEGIINSLKDVPARRGRVVLEISYKERNP
ncbi:MAG: molybdopterin-guanine dinucleotide biosynthesis protein MobB [Sulfolobales archaeon]